MVGGASSVGGRKERPGQRLLDLGWLLGRAVRGAPRETALWAAIALGQGLLVPAQLWLTKLLVDALAAEVSRGQGAATEGALIGTAAAVGTGPFVWLGLLAAALLAQRVLDEAVLPVEAAFRGRVGPQMRALGMAKATRLELAAFERQAYFDRVTRVLDSIESRATAVVIQPLHWVIRILPAAVGYGVALAAVSPLLLGIVVAGWAPAIYAFYAGGRSHFRLLWEQTRERRLANYYAGVLTERPFAKEVRLYQLAGYALERWSTLFWRTRNAQRAHSLRLGLRQRGTILFSTFVGVFGLFWVVTSGLTRATPGEYALLFQALHGIVQTLFGLAGAARNLGEQSGFAGDFREFLALPEEPAATAAVTPPTPSPRSFPKPIAQGVRFEDVWFTYPGAAEAAVRGVTLEIRPGEKVALVGENGAGKSTLTKLLLGLYRPDAGRITVDGIDARDVDPVSWRRAVSAVFQQFVRYHLTLAENVVLGQPERREDRAALAAAVERAGAAGVVAALPRGYESQVGPFAGGVDLSGGEWQRIAVARAFFREAQVLVLDEPTAALDPLAELSVFERFVELVEGRTAVLVSHRLGMARLADRVVVLSQGRVAEDGTHASLLQDGGEYAAIFRAQARWYV